MSIGRSIDVTTLSMASLPRVIMIITIYKQLQNTILQEIHFSENGISMCTFKRYPSQMLYPYKRSNFKHICFWIF